MARQQDVNRSFLEQGHYIWSDGSEYFGEFHEATDVFDPIQVSGLHVGQW